MRFVFAIDRDLADDSGREALAELARRVPGLKTEEVTPDELRTALSRLRPTGAPQIVGGVGGGWAIAVLQLRADADPALAASALETILPALARSPDTSEPRNQAKRVTKLPDSDRRRRRSKRWRIATAALADALDLGDHSWELEASADFERVWEWAPPVRRFHPASLKSKADVLEKLGVETPEGSSHWRPPTVKLAQDSDRAESRDFLEQLGALLEELAIVEPFDEATLTRLATRAEIHPNRLWRSFQPLAPLGVDPSGLAPPVEPDAQGRFRVSPRGRALMRLRTILRPWLYSEEDQLLDLVMALYSTSETVEASGLRKLANRHRVDLELHADTFARLHRFDPRTGALELTTDGVELATAILLAFGPDPSARFDVAYWPTNHELEKLPSVWRWSTDPYSQSLNRRLVIQNGSLNETLQQLIKQEATPPTDVVVLSSTPLNSAPEAHEATDFAFVSDVPAPPGHITFAPVDKFQGLTAPIVIYIEDDRQDRHWAERIRISLSRAERFTIMITEVPHLKDATRT